MFGGLFMEDSLIRQRLLSHAVAEDLLRATQEISELRELLLVIMDVRTVERVRELVAPVIAERSGN
jgi:hypothetical protein